MVAKTNKDRLRETPPASGRLFNEAGEVVNIADLISDIRRGVGSATGILAPSTIAVSELTILGAPIDVSAFSRIFMQIVNTDAAAFLFDAFQIQASPDAGATYEVLYSTSSDFNTPAGILIGTSGNLTVLAASATGWFILDVSGIDHIRVRASANGTQSAGVSGLWSAN